LQEFDPSTGKLATMSASIYARALSGINHKCYHVVANSLESLGQLDKPTGPLALSVNLVDYDLKLPATPHATLGLYSTKNDKLPACLFVLFNGNQGASKFAQPIVNHPQDIRTVVAVRLALPGKMDSKREMTRSAENSSVTVFTRGGGAIKGRLSNPGGGIKLWLSDLVKEHESLPDEFVQPIDSSWYICFSFPFFSSFFPS
jgi:hypothetical protein